MLPDEYVPKHATHFLSGIVEKLVTILACLLLGTFGGCISAVSMMLIVMGAISVASWLGGGDRSYWTLYIVGMILVALAGFLGFGLTVAMVVKWLQPFTRKEM